MILSRKMGESIHVGDSVIVTVLGVARGQVKIGIDAPSDLAVHREEIYQRIQDEKSRDVSKDSASSQSPVDDPGGVSSVCLSR